MALPCGTTGSLYPSFDPARLVGLTVKPASAIALCVRLPSGLSGPLKASDTLLEATTPVKLPTRHGSFFKLGSRPAKGGISTSAPRYLAIPAHCLPPILHIAGLEPMSSCSKGSRGLSVLSRVGGILTPYSISLSARQRQRTSRYAIRAGRNLPDKEFRYLRTVIVTAAVYWGFGSRPRLAANLPP